MRLKTAAAVLLILVGIGAPVLVIVGPIVATSNPASKYTTQAAAVATVTARATASGSLTPTTVYGLRFGASPDIVSSALTTSSGASSSGTGNSNVSWPVKTVSVTIGSKVKKGDVLATADDSSARLQLSMAQATLASAEAKLATDKAGPDATTVASAQDGVNQAQNELNQAIANQTTTKSQNALTLSQAKTAVTTAQAQLDADTAASAPQNVIDADTAALSNAKSQLASTKLKVDQSNQQAAQQVTSAQLSLTAAKHKYTSQVAPVASPTIVADEAAVSSAQVDVDSAKAAVDASSLIAPADGLVSALNIVAGVDAPSGEAIELDVAPLVATASFAESDVANLKVGLPATVAVTAAGVTVNGTVSLVSPVAASSSGGGNSVVTYSVRVTLGDTPAGVLSGMAVSLTITTAQAANVLAVPTGALHGSAVAGYTVQVLGGDGTPKTRTVQIGLVGTSAVEITSGLNEGELVVVTASTTTGGANSRAGAPVFIQGGLP